MKLSQFAQSRDNNFDLLRLFAAGLVLVSHSFPLTGRHEPLAPHTLGTTGVEVFFAISGYLVTKSWTDRPSPREFIRKRASRIFPGLAGAVLVAALVLGPLVSTLSLSDYFKSGGPLRYAASNLLLLPTWALPGVFSSNPTTAVNGSLWTLPVEVRAYLVLMLVGLGGLLVRRLIVPLAMALAVWSVVAQPGPSARLVFVFAGGSALYLLRERIVLRWDIAAALTAVWLLAYTTSLSTCASILALPYMIAVVAYRSPRSLQRLTAHGDVSYGVYVYAFPTQQTIVAIAGVIGPVVLMAVAAPIVWLLGLASWRLVERPALRRARSRRPESSRGEQRVPASTTS